MSNTLYIVVPCYKEEDVLPKTAACLKAKLESLMARGLVGAGSKVLFVNDGSSDGTWSLICQFCEESPIFAGISLSRNRGHQNALLAGLMTAKDHADMVISMDADLQDDPEAIDAMLDKHAQGADIVFGVRTKRRRDSFFKRCSAAFFYKFMSAIGVEIVPNHADFRLMSRRALEALANFKEVNLFLRGIVPMIGFSTATVEYERAARLAGKTKYPLKKMLGFAAEGVTSLSVRPIRIISFLGLLSFLASVVLLIYFLVDYARGGTAAGWASIIVSIWGIGGLQLLAIGIIGEYIGKIYLEVKARPRYIIEKVVLNKGEAENGAD